MQRPALALLPVLVLAGCATYTVPAGGGAQPGAPAIIAADPRFTAGLPLTIAIRRIGDRRVGPQYASVRVAPGRHVLLVDCTLAVTRHTRRYELVVEVEPGGRYRLVGEEAPGNRRCGSVRIEPLWRRPALRAESARGSAWLGFPGSRCPC